MNKDAILLFFFFFNEKPVVGVTSDLYGRHLCVKMSHIVLKILFVVKKLLQTSSNF